MSHHFWIIFCSQCFLVNSHIYLDSNADFENMVIYFKNESLLDIQALEKKTVTPANRFISVRDYKQNMQITEQIM